MPADQSFEGRDARDTADCVPAGYEPPPYFTTAALQQTRVRLTWDEDDEGRRRALARRGAPADLREDDFRVRAECQRSLYAKCRPLLLAVAVLEVNHHN